MQNKESRNPTICNWCPLNTPSKRATCLGDVMQPAPATTLILSQLWPQFFSVQGTWWIFYYKQASGRNFKLILQVFHVPAFLFFSFLFFSFFFFFESFRPRSGIPEFNHRSSHTKDWKIVLDAALLSTQHYKVKIKGKLEKSREWSSVLPYTTVW